MADAALPGDADDLVAPARDALAELARRQRRLGQRLARFEVEASDARPAILTGAFIQMAVVPEQPLGEAARIVGIGANDAVTAAQHRSRRRGGRRGRGGWRSEEHTSEIKSLMRSSYAVFCLTKKNTK